MAGRPTKYLPEMNQIAEDYLAKGFSKAALSAHLNITEETLYKWIKSNEAFSESISIGVRKGMEMMEECLLGKMQGTKKNVDMSAVIFALKTRFHKVYGDKSKHEVEISKVEINIDKDDEKV